MNKVNIARRSARERIIHAVMFEAIANLLVFIILLRYTSAAPAQSGVLTLVSSAVAMGWNYLFNQLFDRTLERCNLRKGYLARVCHAAAFEAGLLLILIPFAAWWLAISLPAALQLECGLVLFFLCYTFCFNLIWDKIRDKFIFIKILKS